MSDEPVQKPPKGYGKRSAKQWILIYVVAAIIIYGLIYLLFFHKSGSGGGYSY
jgi:uncharacterized membrane protein